MKKLLTVLALAASATIGYSQGTINFTSYNPTYAISTNGTSIGAGTGRTSIAAGSYYYALLIQTYTGAATSTINANPLTGWTYTGVTAGNSTIASTYGGVNGGTVAVNGWTAGATEYVEVVGWSASLGTTWAQVEAELTSGNWSANGYYGLSNVGYVTSGGVGTPATPAGAIFSATGAGAFQLNYVTPTPEPTTVALLGLGGLGLAMIRRRK